MGREGRGGGSIDTQLGSCHFLGGEGRGRGGEGGVDRHSTWKGSAKTLEGLPLPICHADPGGGGVQLTLNLERICKDFGRITSANLPMLILGGGQSTLNLEVVIS